MAKAAPYPHVQQRNVDAKEAGSRSRSTPSPAKLTTVPSSAASDTSAGLVANNDCGDGSESQTSKTAAQNEECSVLERGTTVASTAAVDDHFADVIDLAESAAVDDHFADVMDLVGHDSESGDQKGEEESAGAFAAQSSDDEADEEITEAAIEASVVVVDEESDSDDGSLADSLDDSDAFHSASEGEDHAHSYTGMHEDRGEDDADDDDDDFKDAVEQSKLIFFLVNG